MLCPNYKNKEVFDGFNEMVEALGGRPMTEEEFRDSALRNQRTDSDYSAMEAAYKLYHRNNGNFLDKAPNGNPSTLFLTLLDEFGGDKVLAIKAKSRVYSNSFIEWFGDWINDPENASKVVDENGEPLVVYHGTLQEFDTFDFNKLGSVTGLGYYTDHITGEKISIDSSSAFFFSNNKTSALSYGYLARWNEIKDRKMWYNNIIAVLTQNKYLFTKLEGDLKEAQALFIDNILSPVLGYDLRNALNNDLLSLHDKQELVNRIKRLLKNIETLSDARSVSNKTLNLQNRKLDLQYILEHKDDLLNNKLLPYYERSMHSFNGYVLDKETTYVYLSYNNESKSYKVVLNTPGQVDLTPDNFDTMISLIETSILQNELSLLEAIIKSGYNKVKLLPVYLNIKTPLSHDYNGSAFPDSYLVDAEEGEKSAAFFGNDKLQKRTEYPTAYVAARQVKKAKSNGNDGVIYLNVRDPFKMNSYGIFDANQVKSAISNRGSMITPGFSRTDNNIYKLKTPEYFDIESRYTLANLTDVFGENISSELESGNNVSSKDILNQCMFNNIFSRVNLHLARILTKHDIPIKIDNSLGIGTIAETVTDNTGGAIILLNANVLSKVSKNFVGMTLLHEIIHAVTVNAINNPTTLELIKFVSANNKIFTLLNKAFVGKQGLLNNIEYGAYALTNEKEFAAIFMTDITVRKMMYEIASELDVKQNGRVINALKNFVNFLSNLLVNKSLFKNNIAELNNYKKIFDLYLKNQSAVKKGNILSTSQLIEIYNNTDKSLESTERFIERTKDLNRFLDTLEYNSLISVSRAKNPGLYQNIESSLRARKSAIQASNLPVSKKQAAINTTNLLIDMFSSSSTPQYSSLNAIVNTIIPQLILDVDYLRSMHENDETISSSEYMYQKHSNFEMFLHVFRNIRDLLKDKDAVRDIIDGYNSASSIGSTITMDDINTLRTDLDSITSTIEDALSILRSQNDKINAKIILQQSTKARSLEGYEYAALLLDRHNFEDISGLWKNVGSIDSAGNEALRILSTLLDDADNATNASTLKVANTLITAVKALKKGESIKDLYEMYKGKRTGYIVRKVNFGQFYAEYDEAMRKINLNVSNLFKIELDPNNRKAPNDTGAVVKVKVNPNIHISGKEYVLMNATEYWNYLRNNWLSDHCERKYTQQYYDAWASVPQCAKDALDDINSQIRNILVQADAIDDNGYRHLDKLSEKLWKEYNKLQIERKLLYSDYNQLGHLKNEGDIDYTIAKALLALQNKLYPDTKQQRKKNREAWEAARNKIINDPSKTEEDLAKWDLRNSRLVFREDDGHNVWEDMRQELGAAKPSYGKEDQDISDRINKELSPYRLQNGEILADEIPETVKNTVRDLYIKRANLRKELRSLDATLDAKALAYAAIFEKYITYEDNAYILDLQQKLYAQFTNGEYFDEDGFYLALMEYGEFQDYDDSLLGLSESFLFSRWNRHIVAKDKEKYMMLEPGDGWTEREQDSKYINKNFEEYYGSSMVPKISLYKNKQWDKISKLYDPITKKATGSLGNMYKLTLETIANANELQSNRIHCDNYLLPQIMASSLRRLIRSRSHFLSEGINILLEKLGIKRSPDSYLLYGEDSTQELDADGNYITSKIIGTYADGRSFNTIPQYYIKKLEDPSMISSDLVDMLISYHRMSKAYSEKTKIKNDCEAIVDKLKDSKFFEHSYSPREKTLIQGEESNTYKAARLFLDMLMYGLFVKKYRIKNFDVTVAAKTLKQYTTAVNLGMSPKIAIVGFLTSMWTHLINACTGLKYSKRNASLGFFEVLYRLATNYLGMKYINNDQTNDKLMLLMQECNLANRGEKKGEHTNRLSFVQGILGNAVFGFLSTFDFLAKSNILVSTFKAHRMVDGEFMTMDDLARMYYTLPKEEYQRKLELFKKSKNLYSIFKGSNNKLVIEDENYRRAWEKSKNLIKDRALKYAEDADGIATPLQKALMSYTLIGSFFLIHRQYLGLMLQQRWGQRVYDYDTRQYKNSIFRTAVKYFAELIKNNIFSAGVAGAITGLAFGGPFGNMALVGTIIGTISNIIYRRVHKEYQRKSISEINKEFFGTTSPISDMFKSFFGKEQKFKYAKNEKDFMNKRLNFYDIKRILAEILIYNFILAPMVSTIAQAADDDDDNKTWLLMLAYWMRAFLWEAYTPYRPNELFGSIKSASAVSGTLDKISNFFGSIVSVFAPSLWIDVIYPMTNVAGTIADPEENYYSQEITRGAYSSNEFANMFNNNEEERGWTRGELSLFKMTPMHNFYELFKDSKSKRKYIENQIMHVKEDGSSGNYLYNIFFGDEE